MGFRGLDVKITLVPPIVVYVFVSHRFDFDMEEWSSYEKFPRQSCQGGYGNHPHGIGVMGSRQTTPIT